MPKTTYSYRAISTQQIDDGMALVLFAAPAREIELWAGVPQRQIWGEQESVGFQRDLNSARVAKLAKFFAVARNTMQNPLLSAVQFEDHVTFAKNGNSTGRDLPGSIKITHDPLDVPLIEVLRQVATRLVEREPALKDSTPADSMIDRLRGEVRTGGTTDTTTDEEGTADDDEGTADDDEVDDDVSEVFVESHLEQFWLELQARIAILGELGTSYSDDHILGFTREALSAYLKPVLLVDGQHRLAGAIAATRSLVDSAEARREIRKRIRNGETATAVEQALWNQHDRHLPVSMLMTADAAEHVFQFVVVNQKAQPLTRALLGSIVATSLADDELDPIAARLRDAGIPLEESRAISGLIRDAESPFYGVVKRGIEGQDQSALEWNVLGTLVSVFRSLKGGKVPGEGIDHATRWHKSLLATSEVVSDYEDRGYTDPHQLWSAVEGVWRPCFVRFWDAVQDQLASDDPDAFNYWGNPRQSNLFNKVSLHILQSDFFGFLVDADLAIDSEDDIDGYVERWLKNVDPGYFNRDWQLAGVKRDTTGIRNQWGHLWIKHRKEGSRLPSAAQYRTSRPV